MRRFVSLVLVGAAGFLLTMAPLLHFRVYDAVTATPLDPQRASRMEGAGATYFDLATLRSRSGVTIVQGTFIKGDVKAGDDERAVWTFHETLEGADGRRLGYVERRVAFDRRTGAIINCCNEYIGTDRAVRQSGLALRWPVGTQARAYPYYDLTLRRAEPLAYVGSERLSGVQAYRFSQHLGPARIEELPGGLPGSVLGLGGRAPHRVWRHYEVTRTFWVEPVSGTVVRAEESRRQTLRTGDDVDRLVEFQAELRTVPGEIAANLAASSDLASRLTLVRTTLPLACLVLAPLALIGAAVQAVRAASHRRRELPDPPWASLDPLEDQQEIPGRDLTQTRQPDDGAGPAG